MKQTDFAITLTRYFSTYLPGQRNLSRNTIVSYRDVIKQLLIFLKLTYNLKPEKLTLSDITKDKIINFLDWLENTKGVSIRTRNQRLAAIHSFYHYAQIENPNILFESQKILGLTFKKYSKNSIDFLESSCIKIFLAQPDTRTHKGLRDCAILTLLYDSGARVQELINIKVSDIRLTSPATLKLTGKGDKCRIIPLMNKTQELLGVYMANFNLLERGKQDFPLFHNSRLSPFTRPGIAYILKKYYQVSKVKSPELPWIEKIHPHVFRHSKAIHMLEAGVPLIYIRDYLGHVSITTTEIYLRSENKLKRLALEKMYADVESQSTPQWTENKELLQWLNDFCN